MGCLNATSSKETRLQTSLLIFSLTFPLRSKTMYTHRSGWSGVTGVSFHRTRRRYSSPITSRFHHRFPSFRFCPWNSCSIPFYFHHLFVSLRWVHTAYIIIECRKHGDLVNTKRSNTEIEVVATPLINNQYKKITFQMESGLQPVQLPDVYLWKNRFSARTSSSGSH